MPCPIIGTRRPPPAEVGDIVHLVIILAVLGFIAAEFCHIGQKIFKVTFVTAESFLPKRQITATKFLQGKM